MNVKRILSIAVWGVLSLNIAVALLTQTPPVQKWLGRRVAGAIGGALGTEATVGRVGIGLSNRITVDDVCIADLHGDTLLSVSRLSVKVPFVPLLEGRIDITSAQLFGARARLAQRDPESAPNYQFVVDALSPSADSTAADAPPLSIGSLIVRRSSVSYDRGGPCPTRLRFSDISAHVSLKSLSADSVDISLRRLSLKELSGLEVKNLTARVTAADGTAHIRGLHLQLPSTVIALDTLDATYSPAPQAGLTTPPCGPPPPGALHYRAAVGAATIAASDLWPLLSLFPAVRSAAVCEPTALAALPAVNLSLRAEGTAATLSLPLLHIDTSDGGLSMELSGHVSQCGDTPCGSLQMSRLHASSATLLAFSEAFPGIPSPLLRLGDISLHGTALRHADGHGSCEAYIATSLGGAHVVLNTDSHERLSGHIATDSLHLGRLLDSGGLGHADATIAIGGTLGHPEAAATVRRLDFNGHTFRDMEASASWWRDGGIIEARAAARVEHMHPSVIGLTDQWGVEAIAATVDAAVATRGTGGIQGHIRLGDLTMRTATDSVLFSMDRLLISSDTTLRISGDICDGELRGLHGWQSLHSLAVGCIASKLPSLPGLQHTTADMANDGGRAKKTTEAALRLDIADTRWMQPLLGIPLRLERPLHLTAHATDDTIDLDCRLPSFTYGGGRYSDLGVSIATRSDSAICDTRLTRMNDGGGQLVIGIGLTAADDNINTSLTWHTVPPDTPATDDDTKHHDMQGTLNAVARLYTNAEGHPETHADVLPSQIMVDAKPWHIRPGSITYSDGHLAVDTIAVVGGVQTDGPELTPATLNRQHLAVNGRASASDTDTLTADIEGVDIAYIQDILNFHPVDFSGLLHGKVQATALFGDFAARADITARDFRFMDGRMGTLTAKAQWNAADSQIDIDATADDGPHSKTHIDGFVSPVRSDIDLKIRAEGTGIGFCHAFTKSVFSNMEGNARGAVELCGPLGHMNLTGMLTVDGQVTVSALNTTYTLKDDTVAFVPNDIQLRRVAATDRYGNAATVNGGIHHTELTGFTFDFDIDAQNTLVYDFPSFGDSNICGTVQATGHADIHGRPGEVVVNCNATPQAGSSFSYNAANPDAVSRQEFVTWETHSRSHTHSRERANGQEETGRGTSSDLRINFLINATPEATLQLLMDANTGDYITLNGEGIVRAAYHDKGPFQMFGTYNVDHGTYGITIQNIIKKNFTFQRGGTITFGGDPYDAALNLQAKHTVNGVSLSDLNIGSPFANNTVRVNCLMNITGTPSRPQADFDLELPTVNSEEQQMIRSLIASDQEMNQQVLYLLGIGRFYTQGANNADAQQYGQTTLAMQSFLSGTVSTQINEVLSQVIKSNDWNFGANISTGNEGWNNAEYEGMVSGRLLNNRLLINGQFGYRDKATSAAPSFIGDFDLQYLLKRNGTLAVKVYNQTNDRYFTRSSLNTQGVGLVLRKDFDGLGDLLRRKKKWGQ